MSNVTVSTEALEEQRELIMRVDAILHYVLHSSFCIETVEGLVLEALLKRADEYNWQVSAWLEKAAEQDSNPAEEEAA